MATATVSSESALHQLRTIEKLRRVNRSILLYQAGDDPYVFKVDGEKFIIPPDGPWRGPDDAEEKNYDGTLPVNDIYGVPRAEVVLAKKERRLQPRKLEPTELRLAALAIVSHAVSHSGGRIVALIGEESEMDELKKQAREAWLLHKKNTAEDALAAFRRRNEMLVKAGREPELMDEHLSRQQMWLDEYRSGEYSTKKFICPIKDCGFQVNDEALMTRHLSVSHNRAGRKKSAEALIQTTDDGEQPARRRGRPPVQ